MKVRDIMTTRVITISPDALLREALQVMNEKGFRRLPVVENGILVGMLVKYDIEKALNRPVIFPETPVDWIMSKDLVTVSPDDNIMLAARLFLDRKIGGIPVVENSRLVGIITDSDILKAFIEMGERNLY